MIIVILLLLHWTLTPGASGKIKVSLSPRRKESGMSYKENLTLSEKSEMDKMIILAKKCNYVISTSLY